MVRCARSLRDIASSHGLPASIASCRTSWSLPCQSLTPMLPNTTQAQRRVKTRSGREPTRSDSAIARSAWASDSG